MSSTRLTALVLAAMLTPIPLPASAARFHVSGARHAELPSCNLHLFHFFWLTPPQITGRDGSTEDPSARCSGRRGERLSSTASAKLSALLH